MQFIKNLFVSSKQSSQETKSYNPYMTLTMGAGSARWSGCDYHTSSKRGYHLNPIMYACIRMIADGATRVPIILKKSDKPLVNHGLLNLLKSPSSDSDGRIFKSTIFSNLLLSGNAYIDCVAIGNSDAKPQALFILRPDRVSCVIDKSGFITGYDYRAGSVHKRYPIERMLHLKFFSPLDDYYGTSPTQAAWRAVELHNEATTFQKALLDNAARPSGCLIYSGLPGSPNLTETQFMRLKSELQEHYTGAAAAGRPMVLEGGLDWKTMALTPNDMGINAMRYDAARDIALAFGVPPMLLGIPGDNTYSNYQEAIRVFTRNTLIPMAEIFYDALSDKMSKLYNEDLNIVIDREKVAYIFTDYLT